MKKNIKVNGKLFTDIDKIIVKDEVENNVEYINTDLDNGATAAQMATGVSAYVNGELIEGTGTIADPTASAIKILIERKSTPSAANLFESGTNLTYERLSKILNYSDTENVTNMNSMFRGCYNLTTVPLFNTSKATNMSNMFNSCSKLTTVPLFDTSNVTVMNVMFEGCANLTTVPLFDTSKATNMNCMFYQCTKLTTVPLFNTSNVTNMSEMFVRCDNLTSVPLFNTSEVDNMSNMFNQCVNLTSIPAFNTSNVTNMGNMLYYCIKLEEIHMYGMKVSFDISSSTKFTRDALVEILNNLGTVTTTRTLTMGSTNLAKLTEEDKHIAFNKGWTLA